MAGERVSQTVVSSGLFRVEIGPSLDERGTPRKDGVQRRYFVDDIEVEAAQFIRRVADWASPRRRPPAS